MLEFFHHSVKKVLYCVQYTIAPCEFTNRRKSDIRGRLAGQNSTHETSNTSEMLRIPSRRGDLCRCCAPWDCRCGTVTSVPGLASPSTGPAAFNEDATRRATVDR